MKFAIYGNTVVIVTREESGPTLIELNYYKLDEEAAPRWHFNRAIDYLSDINKIIIDEKRAFLIGTNIHYIYKHSIYSDFIKDEELIFYEFVDRDMEDFDLLTGRFDELLGDVKISHFGYSFYYSFTGKGIDCYQL
jgi:hypothetical protein